MFSGSLTLRRGSSSDTRQVTLPAIFYRQCFSGSGSIFLTTFPIE